MIVDKINNILNLIVKINYYIEGIIYEENTGDFNENSIFNNFND